MSYLYVPPADSIVRRVAVGKAPRPAGRDGIDAAADDAHAALLLAPWEVSDKAPHMPVHEYDRAIPDGDAWKGVYGYDETARTLRVAAGAVCYSFPIPPDAMREDSEATPPVSPALVESLSVRVIGDRYLDQGAVVRVAFTETDEPPAFAAFVADEASVAASAVVCATAPQGVTPNERIGKRATAEIDYGENPAAPAAYCHVCLALADYVTARGAWVEGGAQLDPESIGVKFDRDLDPSFSPPDEGETLLLLDLGATTSSFYMKTADVAVDTSKTYYAYDAETDSYTAVVSPNASGLSGYYEKKTPAVAGALNGRRRVLSGSRTQTSLIFENESGTAISGVYIDPFSGRRNSENAARNIVAEVFRGLSDDPDGRDHEIRLVPHVIEDDEPRSYGIITEPGREVYAIAAFSRSGLHMVAGEQWQAVRFLTPHEAFCDCRVVVLGGMFDSCYSTAGTKRVDENGNVVEPGNGFEEGKDVLWTAVLPDRASLLALRRATMPPEGFAVQTYAAKGSDGKPTGVASTADGTMKLLAWKDFKKGGTIEEIRFDTLLAYHGVPPAVATVYVAFFPLGEGGGCRHTDSIVMSAKNTVPKEKLISQRNAGTGQFPNSNIGYSMQWKKQNWIWQGGGGSSTKTSPDATKALQLRIDATLPEITGTINVQYYNENNELKTEVATYRVPVRSTMLYCGAMLSHSGDYTTLHDGLEFCRNHSGIDDLDSPPYYVLFPTHETQNTFYEENVSITSAHVNKVIRATFEYTMIISAVGANGKGWKVVKEDDNGGIYFGNTSKDLTQSKLFTAGVKFTRQATTNVTFSIDKNVSAKDEGVTFEPGELALVNSGAT